MGKSGYRSKYSNYLFFVNDSGAIYTTTSVEFTDNESDSLILNSEVADSNRISQFLEMMREQYGNFPKVMIQSENHVPTAAGLASSASSFAALTAAMFGLLDLEKDDSEMSRIARRGSGSASRSIFGNFAVWNKGENHQSSFAESFYNEDIGLSMIVAEISAEKKKCRQLRACNWHKLHQVIVLGLKNQPFNWKK